MDVATLVQNVIIAYRNATTLVQRVKDRRNGGHDTPVSDEPWKDLEDSLSLGPPVIKGHYEYDLKRFGDPYACGDAQAREQMKDVLITLQMHLLTNLQMVDDGPLDMAALQMASDEGRVNAVVCLGQFSQRMSASATAQALLSQSPNGQWLSKPDLLPPPLQYSTSRSTYSSGESQPLTPLTPVDRFAQMSLQKSVYKQPGYVDRITSIDSMDSNNRTTSAREFSTLRRNFEIPRQELPSRPKPASRNESVDSIDGLRRASSQALGPEDSAFLATIRALRSPSSHAPSVSYSVELDALSVVSSEPNHTSIASPDFSPDVGAGHYVSSRDRANPGNASDMASRRGRLDEATYRNLYGNWHFPSPVERPIPTPSSGTSDYGTLQHGASLQMNSRSPMTSTISLPYLQQPAAFPPYETFEHLGESMPFDARNASQLYPLHDSQRNDRPGFTARSTSLLTSLTSEGKAAPEPSHPRAQRSHFQLRNESSASLPAPKPGQPSYLLMGPGPPPSIPLPSPTAGLSSFLRPASSHSLALQEPPPQSPTYQTAITTHNHTAPKPTLPLTLPSENQLLGLCESGVKLHAPTAEPKKSFVVAHRPAGMTGRIDFWVCKTKHCIFEGPVVTSVVANASNPKKSAKAEKCFDPRVRVSPPPGDGSPGGGIRYRWIFLAKCHVLTKSFPDGVAARDGTSGAFGCVFCAAEGERRGWPNEGGKDGDTTIFRSVGSFMAHLQMHRLPEGMPCTEMLNRFRCVAGRVADASEEFDVNLTPL